MFKDLEVSRKSFDYRYKEKETDAIRKQDKRRYTTSISKVDKNGEINDEIV